MSSVSNALKLQPGWTSAVYIHCVVDCVVGTSKFQTAQPDALFVVFLGIEWAYGFAKKLRKFTSSVPNALKLQQGWTSALQCT